MAETISQYLQQIQAKRDADLHSKIWSFMPLVDQLIRKSAQKEEIALKRTTAENDIRAQAGALGYTPEEIDGFLSQNSGVSPEGLPAMFNQYDKQRIMKSDLKRFGADVPDSVPFSDLSNLHSYYSKASSQGEEALREFNAKLKSGANPESALRDVEFTSKYRSTVREKFGERYATQYEQAIASGKSPDLAFNAVAVQFERDHPKPSGGGGGGGGKDKPKYSDLINARVGKEGEGSEQGMFVYWTNQDGVKVKAKVYKGANGKMLWADTKEEVNLEDVEDVATINQTEYKPITKLPYSAKKKSAPAPSPAKGKPASLNGVVWE